MMLAAERGAVITLRATGEDADAALAASVRERRLSYAAAVQQGLFRPLGDGGAHISDVLTELRSVGYDGWYVLEQDVMLDHEPAPGPPERIVRSADYARKHG
jgi:inosose dehydratase